MNNTSTKPFNPIAAAQQTATAIENTLTEKHSTDSMLAALQAHYDMINQNQQLYIEYLTELVGKLKVVQKGDKESFAALKKEVIKHVLNSEKKSTGV